MNGLIEFGKGIQYDPVMDRFQYEGDFKGLELSQTLTAYLYLTLDCNLKCGFCKRDSPLNPLTPEINDLKEIFDSLAPNGQPHRTVVTGGEPFLVENIEELLRYAAEQGHIINLTSNGILVRPSRSLVDSVAMFEIGLDGPDEETYTSMRRVDEFSTVVGNIDELSNMGSVVRVTYLLTKVNYEKAREMPRLCSDLGINMLRLQRIRRVGRFLRNIDEFDLSEEEVRRAVIETREEAERYGVDLRTPMVAPIHYGTVHIYPEGDIVTRRNPEKTDRGVIGNLHEGSMEDFWDPILADAHKNFVLSQNRV
ncbi:hypothetical protein CL618_01405 [archaeon]|nr:hypothetical protein [archaeon]|tara:strand:- start:6227 stop:7153 length:927 start_codon:yes stop_codon:yes gene_type:complete